MTQRRNLLKALSVASIPAAWTRPVVEAVVLPAHARTSSSAPALMTPETPPDPVFMIQCDVGPIEEGRCDQAEIQFQVFGMVSGGNLEGVMLEIEYVNEQTSGDPDGVVPMTTPVQAGNSFSVEFEANPPDGQWADLEGTVTVRFQDQVTYGTAECSSIYDCSD